MIGRDDSGLEGFGAGEVHDRPVDRRHVHAVDKNRLDRLAPMGSDEFRPAPSRLDEHVAAGGPWTDPWQTPDCTSARKAEGVRRVGVGDECRRVDEGRMSSAGVECSGR